MAKIVLIYPNFEPPVIYKKNDLRDTPGIPVGILSIASLLKEKKYEVKIIDTRIIERNPLRRIIDECKDASLVGISAMTAQVKNGLEISKLVKEKTKAKIVWGGIHPTLFPIQTCQNKYVDFVVIWEGEETMVELLEELEKKKNNFEKIKGLVFKRGNKVIRNEPKDILNMDNLPYLHYEIIELNRYLLKSLPKSEQKVRTLVIETSRGCPHRCTFCIHVVGNDRRYRSKSVERTIKELKAISKKYNIKMIGFVGDNFFVNRKWVKELLTEMINEKINLRWAAECRADYFRKGHIDGELLELMKESGCASFTIGGESGSQKILDFLKKDITVKDIENSARMCNKYGIVPSYSFITGIPGETKKDAKKTAQLIVRLKKLCPDSFGGVGVFTPFPGGDLYNITMKKGRLKEPKKLEDWAKKEYMSMMLTRAYKIPWNKNEKFMLNFSHYANLYFFSNLQLLRYIKRNFILGLGYAIFVIVARIRFRISFFNFPTDKWLYDKALDIFGYNI